MTDTNQSFRELCNSPTCRKNAFIFITDCPECKWDCNPKLSTMTLDELKSELCKYISEWNCVFADRYVAVDDLDEEPWTLYDQIKWCWSIKIEVDFEWGKRILRICSDPSLQETKFTDLVDGPKNYWDENCWYTDCDETNSNCDCTSSQCIWAVLMPKCGWDGVERRCMEKLLIWEIWMDKVWRYELQLPAETEWPKFEVAMDNNAIMDGIPDWQNVYINSWISERIVISKAWRYDIFWQVQYAVNKYVNAVRFWLYNWTTNTEYQDFKDWWRLNSAAAGQTWFDTSYCRDPPQNVAQFDHNLYMQWMFYTATIHTSERLEPWQYSIVGKIDTRTDGTWTQIWRITIIWRNGDTVLSEQDPALTYLTIEERPKTYIPVCPSSQ